MRLFFADPRLRSVLSGVGLLYVVVVIVCYPSIVSTLTFNYGTHTGNWLVGLALLGVTSVSLAHLNTDRKMLHSERRWFICAALVGVLFCVHHIQLAF